MSDDKTTQTTTTDSTPSEAEKLRGQMQHWQAKATDLEKTLAKFKDIDPEKYHATIEELENLQRETAGGDKVKIDKIITNKTAEIEGRYSKKLTETEKALEAATKEVKRYRVVNPTMIKAAAVFNDDVLPLIQRIVEESCDIDGEDVVIKDRSGNIRPSIKDPRNARMSIDEFLSELATTYKSAAKSNYVDGHRQGNTNSAGGGGKLTKLPAGFENLPQPERVRIMSENPELRKAALSGRA